MEIKIFNFLFILQVFLITVTEITSKELLKALYDYEEPLLLDEQKSRKIAEHLEKQKGETAKGPEQFFSQLGINYDDYNELPIKEDERNGPNKNPGRNVRATTKKPSDEDCPQDVPTYRIFMSTKCVTLNINDQKLSSTKETGSHSTEKPEKSEEKSFNQRLINYLQLDKHRPYVYFDKGGTSTGNELENENNGGKYDQRNGPTQKEIGTEKEIEKFNNYEEWNKLSSNREREESNKPYDYQGKPSRLENPTNQQPSGSNEQHPYYNKQQESVPEKNQLQKRNENQPILPFDYGNEAYSGNINHLDSSIKESAGKHSPKIPTSVNVPPNVPPNVPHQVDFDENFPNEVNPNFFIGHHPWGIEVPLDNDIDQNQVNNIPPVSQYDDEKFSCIGKEPGFYTDFASDCRKFYRCSPNDPRVFRFFCGAGTKFHSIKLQCMHEKHVDCAKQTKQLSMK